MLNKKEIKGHQDQRQKLLFLLQRGKIPQTLLFSGIAGIGKKKIAELFIKSIFCNSGSSCGKCRSCVQIQSGTFPDLIEIVPNEKGIIPIGSEEKKESGSIRWLIDRLSKKSISSKYIALIDGIDRVSESGQNALLKTIEEPGEQTHIIIISSSRNRVLPTILSRCFEIKFFPLLDNQIQDILVEDGISVSNAEFISRISGGSLEIAHNLANQDILNEILNICMIISLSIKGKSILNIDLKKIQKMISTDNLIDIILNIFRLNLLLIHNTREIKSFSDLDESLDISKEGQLDLKNIFLNDAQTVMYLIKIFLALKKGQMHNLNIRSSIKGMLYFINSDYKINMPFLE